jgi:hypothetical protein
MLTGAGAATCTAPARRVAARRGVPRALLRWSTESMLWAGYHFADRQALPVLNAALSDILSSSQTLAGRALPD